MTDTDVVLQPSPTPGYLEAFLVHAQTNAPITSITIHADDAADRDYVRWLLENGEN